MILVAACDEDLVAMVNTPHYFLGAVETGSIMDMTDIGEVVTKLSIFHMSLSGNGWMESEYEYNWHNGAYYLTMWIRIQYEYAVLQV